MTLSSEGACLHYYRQRSASSPVAPRLCASLSSSPSLLSSPLSLPSPPLPSPPLPLFFPLLLPSPPHQDALVHVSVVYVQADPYDAAVVHLLVVEWQGEGGVAGHPRDGALV